jgi:hypothetical protein
MPGLSPERARRVVAALASNLAEASLPPEASARLTGLNLNLMMEAGEEESVLAARIVAGLMVQIAHSE